MSLKELLKDLNESFSLKNFISGVRGEREYFNLGDKIPIDSRGRKQSLCFAAHLKSWYYSGTTQNYCHYCKGFQRETCLSDPGITEVCQEGFWRTEAN